MRSLLRTIAHIQESSIASLVFAVITVLVLLVGVQTGLLFVTPEGDVVVQEQSVLGEDDKKGITGQEESDFLGPYEVDRVVDGDTVRVLVKGESETLRLIGVDTPETVHPTKGVECFGVEAKNYLTQLLDGQDVFLESDASQGDQDKYNRWLRYVYLVDDKGDLVNVNQLLIENGYAHEYTYNLPYKYQETFQMLESQARGEGVGLWSDVCDY